MCTHVYFSLDQLHVVEHVGVVYPPFTLKSCPMLEVKSDLSKGTSMDNLPS